MFSGCREVTEITKWWTSTFTSLDIHEEGTSKAGRGHFDVGILNRTISLQQWSMEQGLPLRASPL